MTYWKYLVLSCIVMCCFNWPRHFTGIVMTTINKNGFAPLVLPQATLGPTSSAGMGRKAHFITNLESTLNLNFFLFQVMNLLNNCKAGSICLLIIQVAAFYLIIIIFNIIIMLLMWLSNIYRGTLSNTLNKLKRLRITFLQVI